MTEVSEKKSEARSKHTSNSLITKIVIEHSDRKNLKTCSIRPPPDAWVRGVPVVYGAEFLNTPMRLRRFREFMIKEGLLFPDKPPRKGMSRINVLPTTDAGRMNLHPKPIKKPPKPAPPTITSVATINLSPARFFTDKPLKRY